MPPLSIEEIKARQKKICICKAISQAKVVSAIEAGANSVEAVNKAIGSGSGDCRGTRCSHVIAELIEKTAQRNKT